MIKYKLVCKDCDTSFDSWFSSSVEFEKLKKKKYLNCYSCGSYNVDKTLMAPQLINKSKDEKKVEILNSKKLRKKLIEYRKFIKDNFENVGDNFAYEARSIHYKSKKMKKGIYGTASNNELRELKEEGIQTEVIPWIEDKNN